MESMKTYLLGLMGMTFIFIGCASIPSGLKPVSPFDAVRYQGKWYEIARMDHWFEQGLNNVTATYDLRADGTLDVLNRGFDPQKEEWKEARGKARFSKDKTVGSLKVTFFWPFSGAYNVIELDQELYSYAMVCGSDRSYLWILSRTPKMKPVILESMMKKAEDWGFDLRNLILVEHDRSDAP